MIPFAKKNPDTFQFEQIGNIRSLAIRFFLFVFSMVFLAFMFVLWQGRLESHRTEVDSAIFQIEQFTPALEAFNYDILSDLGAQIVEKIGVIKGIFIEDRYETMIFSHDPLESARQDIRIITLTATNNADTSVGKVTLFIEKPAFFTGIRTAVLFSLMWSLLILGPAYFALRYYTVVYIVTPLRKIDQAIRSALKGKPKQVGYEGDDAFAKIVQKFNLMQTLNKDYSDKIQLSLKEQKLINSKLKAANQEVIRANDDISKRTQIIDDLLFYKNQFMVYQLEGSSEVHSNYSKLHGKSSEIIKIIATRPELDAAKLVEQIRQFPDLFQNIEPIENEEPSHKSNLVTYLMCINENCYWRIDVVNSHKIFKAVVLTDVSEFYATERKRAQDAKLRSLGLLSSGIAHDFNNILAIISAAVEVENDRRKSQTTDADELALAQTFDVISSATLRATAITRKILNFAKQKPLSKEQEDISKILHQMETLLQAALPGNIELELEIEDNLWAMFNSDDFQNSILNLTKNSTEAMPNGGTITIKANLRSNKGAYYLEDAGEKIIELTLSDTGTGMLQDVAKMIFDPFFTTKGIGNGTGLGLSVVASFVEHAKGTVRCFSKLGEGTSMRILIPHSEQPIKATPEPEAKTPPKAKTSLQGKSIAIIEDEPQLLKLFELALTNAGAEVQVYTSFDQWRKYLETDDRIEFNIVLSDHNLKDGNSKNVLNLYRAHEGSGKFVVMTGNVDRELEHFFEENEVKLCLRKPVRMSELIAICQE